MKEKNKKILFKKELEEERELKSKWWHRLVKVFIYFFTVIVFFFFLFLLIGVDGESIISIIIGSLFFSLITYLFLNIIYYRVILYIVYGKKEYSQIWSIKKIGIFVLIIFFLLGLCRGISSLEKNNVDIDQDQLLSEEKLLETEKDIIGKIEDIKIENIGNKYCIFKSVRDEQCTTELTTEGKFFRVETTLKNISKKTITVFWDLGSLIDDQEREYISYSQSQRTSTVPEKSIIAPGFSDTREEIYEVPLDSKASKIKIIGRDFEDQLLEIK